ncbi:MAG TPA: MFS transporter [Jatrophihabitantaceae bacterium]|jgi:MFS family permease
MSAPAVAVTEPTVPVSRAWTARFSLVWLGVWMATLVPVQLALPDQLDDIDPAHKVRDFGLINGLVGIVALITLPLFGALCDRTRSRLGRRRVWVIAGVGVYAAGLLLTGLQTTWIAVGLAWAAASLGANMAMAGLTAAIADEVPDGQRGYISSAIYGPQAIGIVVGLIAVEGVHAAAARYAILAVALLAFATPFIRAYRDVPPVAAAAPMLLRAVAGSLRIRSPDFGWAFGARLLVNLGNALGTTYLLYFLRDDLRVHDPDGSLLVLTVIYLVFTLGATYAGGILSDRTGRRRVFVATASILQAIAALQLTFFPSFGTALVAAAFLGAGYGAFMSVDQALITAVLPDAADRARDLGIMNVGSVGPQALAPLAASLVIGSLGGYSMLFGAAGVVTLVGAVMVYRIRSVR